MWIPFELGQTVYIVVDNGYNTEHTIHDGYDHLGEIVRRETVHHPLLEVKCLKKQVSTGLLQILFNEMWWKRI